MPQLSEILDLLLQKQFNDASYLTEGSWEIVVVKTYRI